MSQRTTIAIIGAGFAGLSAYLMLRKRLGKTVDIKIFDIRDKFTYTPGLHVTVGDADYLDGIQFSLPAYYGSDFVHAEVTKITKAHELHTATGDVWMFDYAVIATGSRTDYFGNDTFEKHAYTIRHPEDIAPLNKALDSAEIITVIGGGFTGVEVVSVAASRFPKKNIRIIHGRERLLHNMSLATSKLATKRLQEHHVDVILNNKVAEIGPDYVTLQSGEKLASDATILVSGIKRNNELHEEEVSFQTSHISQESENILTCGDVSEYGLYTTAHNAMLEGRRIGEIIADKIHGITPNYPELINWPFLMLALGPYDGLFTTPNYCIPAPLLTGFSKWFIEQRVLFEFKYKIMLPV